MFSIQAYAAKPFEDQYIIREYSMEDGLPCDFIDDVIVDHSGFAWVATSGGGLCRLDGYDILTFNASGACALKSNFVKKLQEDSFRRLWIASEGGLDILDLKTLQLTDIGLPEQGNTVCNYVTKDAKGCIWANIGPTLWRFAFDSDGSLKSAIPFAHNGLGEGNIVFKDVDNDGSVWISLEGHIYKVSAREEDGKLEDRELFPQLEIGEDTYVSDYLSYGDRLWISTEQGLLLMYKPTGEWKRYVTDPRSPRSLTQNFVSSLAVAPNGQILASTLHGLNVYNPVSDDFEMVGEDVINGLTVSKEYILVGTENRGLKVMKPKILDVRN